MVLSDQFIRRLEDAQVGVQVGQMLPVLISLRSCSHNTDWQDVRIPVAQLQTCPGPSLKQSTLVAESSLQFSVDQ